MEAAELRQVSQSISNSIGGNIGQFRRATEEHERSLFKIVKDLSSSMAAQRRELAGLSNTFDEILDNESNQTEKMNQTNSLLQDSISLQSQTVAEMKNLVFGIKDLGESISYLVYNNNSPFNTLGKSLGDVITGGLGGLGNIIKGVGLLGGAGLAGAGIGYMASGGGAQLQGGGDYTPEKAASLIRKAGGSAEEATLLGAISQPESSGNPMAHNFNPKTGDDSYGLWQINLLGKMGPERMKKFGLSRPEDLYNPETNARVALQMYRERGNAEDWSTYKKGSHLRYIEAAKKGATGNTTATQTATPTTPSSATDTTAQATPVSQTPVTPSVTPTSATTAEHGHGHEGIISSAGKGSNDAASAKSFLQSRQGGGGVGVNADKLNSEFAVKMANAIQQAESATGSKAVITEGYRPAEVQAQYYANYIQQPVPWNGQMYYPQKKGGIAAPPGRSRHQRGLAVDLADNPVREWLTAHAGQLGLGRVPGDPPHFQGGGPGGEELGGSTPTSIPGPLTPGSSPMPDMAARQAQLESLISSMGGGVPGYGAAATPAGAEAPTGAPINIPTGGMGPQAPMAAAAPMLSMASSMLGGMGMGGIVGALAPMLMSAISSPNLTPAAQMMPDLNALRNASIVNQSEVLSQAEDYNYKQAVINSNVSNNNESESLSGAQASMGAPTGHDYNAPWDLDFGPSWPELVSWAFPEVASKIKPSPYQR